MISNIIAFGALVTAVSASLYGHGHPGHAVSFQSLIRHDEAPYNTAHHAILPVYYAAAITHNAPPVAHYAAPVAHYDGHDTYTHPKYDLAHSVAAPHTSDHKSQHESRDKEGVLVYYLLAHPDVAIRKPEYSTDNAHKGFNALVLKSASSVHTAPVHGHYHY